MWAIIGGSGFEHFDDVREIRELDRSTPFGETSSGLRLIDFGGHEVVFLSRHGRHHELTPTEINYRANIYALKKYGVRKVISISAVGSLRKELAPGDLVVPSQYIDRTKGVRPHTYLGDGLVGHVSLAKPTWTTAAKAIQKLNCATHSSLDFNIHFDKTYVTIEGPYFSTQAESNAYRQMGADIIGMTHFPEFALAREAGLCYVPCCFVTDYDCWDDTIEHVTIRNVLETMQHNNKKAVKLIAALLLDDTPEDRASRDGGLRTSLMTPRSMVPVAKREWLEVLCA